MGHPKMPKNQPMPRAAKRRTRVPAPDFTIKPTWQVGTRTPGWDALWKHILDRVCNPTSGEVEVETANLPDEGQS